MKKKLSIVIPVYNVEKFIKRCLDSIINQNEDNLEIILVDDGSKDNSVKICEEYSKKYSYIKTFHKKKWWCFIRKELWNKIHYWRLYLVH